MELFSCDKQPAFFCNQDIMPVLTAAASELDQSKRKELLQQAAQIDHDNPPALYLVQQVDINGISQDLHGFDNQNRIFPDDQMTVG